MFLADTLAAAHAGREELSSDISPDNGPRRGFLRYERTLMPLDHFGPQVFQPFINDQNLRNIIRSGKENPNWHPFSPERINDYHYDQNGTTRNSQSVYVSLKQVLQESKRAGYQFESRYMESWGPFPNQQTTRFETLAGLSVRVKAEQTVSVKLLGFDHGWHLRRNNTIYTDRARYILDDINPWRARTGGFELSMAGHTQGSGSYQLYMRGMARQGTNEPTDLQRLQPPVTAAAPVFIHGVLPATMPSGFSSHRTQATYTLGAQATFAYKTNHEISAGMEAAYLALSHREFWRPAQVPFEMELSFPAYEIGGFLQDRFRSGNIVMDLGLRYDGYIPGTTRWRDIYQTLGDSRVFQEQFRQLLITSSVSAGPIHVISPSFSVAYPTDHLTVHMTFSTAYQRADLEALYTLADSSPSGYTTRSDTQLYPQRKTTIEGGFGLYAPSYSMDVTAFYRNAERYIPVFGPDVLPQSVSNYSGYWGRVNADLKKQSGVEITLIRPSLRIRRSRVRFSGRLSYLYLKDIGSVSPADRSLQPGPSVQPGDYTTFDRQIKNYWNRRHWLSVSGAFRFPAGFVITSVGHIQSGVPFRLATAVETGDIVPVDQLAPVQFGPWHIRLDARIDMPVFKQPHGVNPSVFVEIRNLLNRKNVEIIPDPRSFEATGQPDNPISDQQQWVYGPARVVWLGLGLRW